MKTFSKFRSKEDRCNIGGPMPFLGCSYITHGFCTNGFVINLPVKLNDMKLQNTKFQGIAIYA